MIILSVFKISWTLKDTQWLERSKLDQATQFQVTWLLAINFGHQVTWSAMGPKVT